MTVDNLKEYLKIVVDMEKNKLTQETVLSQLEDQMNQASTASIPKEPSKPIKKEYFSPSELITPTVIMIGIGIFLFIRGIRGLSTNTIFGVFGALIMLLLAAILTIFAIGFFLRSASEYNNEEIRFNEEQIRYNKEYAEYKKKEKQHAQQLAVENSKKTALSLEYNKLKDIYESQCKTLQFIYDADIIDPKYRYLIAVASFYEYISIGICEQLKGHEGAYKHFEEESRAERLLLQMNKISQNLGEIKENQYMLYSVIEESNRNTEELIQATRDVGGQVERLRSSQEQHNMELEQSINKIHESSAISAYAAKCTQQEVHYMNRMNYLTGKYDGVWDNIPPKL